MNLLLLKQLAILSAFAGAILGLVTIIPYVSMISFFIAFLFLSAFILVYMKRNDLIGILSLREGCLFGAVVGFVSFLAFSIVYAPVSMIIGAIFHSYTQGFLRFFVSAGFGSTVVMIMLIVFSAGLSALFNGFTGLITAYVYELLTGIRKEADENTTIDFEVK